MAVSKGTGRPQVWVLPRKQFLPATAGFNRSHVTNQQECHLLPLHALARWVQGQPVAGLNAPLQ